MSHHPENEAWYGNHTERLCDHRTQTQKFIQNVSSGFKSEASTERRANAVACGCFSSNFWNIIPRCSLEGPGGPHSAPAVFSCFCFFPFHEFQEENTVLRQNYGIGHIVILPFCGRLLLILHEKGWSQHFLPVLLSCGVQLFPLFFSGDCICFHNNRVMHGRTGYQAMEAGERELEGGYLDWDELRSKRRILQQKLGITAQG